MNLQEILTYVEEIEFKNSMFGYDKDEVDIQLDKICDEVEALVNQKDKEIEELKKTITRNGGSADINVSDLQEAKDDMVSREEYDAIVKECAQLKGALDQAKEAVFAAKEDAAHANEAASLMISEVQNAQLQLKEKQNDLAAANAKIEILEQKLNAAKEAPVVEEVEEVVEEVEEVVAEEVTEPEGVKELVAEEVVEEAEEIERVPQTTDEAYQQYMRYADLLCKQLAEVETKHEKIVAEATAEADDIRANAQKVVDDAMAAANLEIEEKAAKAAEEATTLVAKATEEATTLVAEAKAEADKVVTEAKAEAEKAVTEAKEEALDIVNKAKAEADEIGQESLMKAAVAEEQCKALADKKDSLMASLTGFGEEIAALIAKVQGTEEAEATEE